MLEGRHPSKLSRADCAWIADVRWWPGVALQQPASLRGESRILRSSSLLRTLLGYPATDSAAPGSGRLHSCLVPNCHGCIMFDVNETRSADLGTQGDNRCQTASTG